MEIGNNYFLSFVSGALVSALGLFLAYLGLDKIRQRKKIKGFSQALYEELKEIGNAYNRDVKIHWEGIEKYGEEVFMTNISLTQDYSTIYHSNANLIGQIPNSKLRRRIVKTYTSLKVLVDYYKQSNRMLDEYGKYYEKDKSSEETFKYWHMLRNFTQLLLQKRHNRFLRLNKILLKTLEKELSNPSYENPTQTISILRSSIRTTQQLS